MRAVSLGIYDAATQAFAAVAPRTDPDYTERYAEHWASRNVLWSQSSQVPVGRLFTSDDFVPRERYLSSAFYNEWCRRQGIDATLAANVLLDGTVSAVAAVYRPWSRGGDFDRREQAIFSALTPHLQRAVQIHVRMSQPKRERANWLKILDGLRQAVLIPPIDSLHETDGNLTGDLQQKLEADENYPQRESRLAPPSRRTHRIKRAEQIRRGQRRELSSAGGKPGRPGRSIAASDAAPRNLRVASVGRQAVVR